MKKNTLIKGILIFVSSALLLSFCGCSSVTEDIFGKDDNNSNVESRTDSLTEEETEFSNRDKSSTYDEAESTNIDLSTLNGGVTISKEGTYVLTGTLEDGQVQINVSKETKVQLVLNNASITNKTGAALYVISADKVFVTTAENTTNYIINDGEFAQIDDNNINAALYSKDDLTLNGTGKLVVKSSNGHGISCKDDLVFYGGEYEITSQGHGVDANDSIKLGGNPKFTINSTKDGFHAENSEDSTKGYIYVEDGSYTIVSKLDSFDSKSVLQIENGTFDTTSGTYTSQKSEGGFGGGFSGRGGYTQQTEEESTKAFKSTGDMTINNGTFNVVTGDDAFHTNANLYINGGTYTVKATDDAFHADVNNVISGGKIEVTICYEGVEGKSVTINGGDIKIYATDDGLNAADASSSSEGGGFGGFGGNSSSNSDVFIKINGGTIVIDAAGDGLDSNGNFYVTGGVLYCSGSTDASNATLDFDGTGTITGGLVVATGNSGMAQNFGTNSTQGSIMYTTSNTNKASTQITLTDEDGNVIASYEPPKSFNCVIISSPSIKKGSTYTVTVGNNSSNITMTSLIYGSGNGMGGNQGGPGGNQGGPGGNQGGPGGRRW